MARPLRIYLSGSIRKGAADLRSPDHFWTRDDEEFIRANAGGSVELLNPAKTDIRRQDYAINFGCDLHLVSIADIVLVDARREKGIGVGAEMMFAVQRGIPVVTWAPADTHYRRSKVADLFGEDLHDWMHPFVFGLSDRVVSDLAEAMAFIRSGAAKHPTPRRREVTRLIRRYRNSIGQTGHRAPKRFIAIGGDVFQDVLGGGSEQEIIAGVTRYRFMDVLYLPSPTDSISPEAMLAVNRWRERRLNDRPLLHSTRIRRLTAAAAATISQPPSVFEIGCGKFPIVDEFPCRRWMGLEIDGKAVEYLVGRGLRTVVSTSQITVGDLDVDLAVALFCMQFAIEEEELELLGRLPINALIMLNLPTRDTSLVRRRLGQLRGLGLHPTWLDLQATGSKDVLVLAGRSGASSSMERACKAVMAQAVTEWPSAGLLLKWSDPE